MKLLALISLLGSLALLTNAFLIFSPPSLALTSELVGGSVSVRLAAPPPRTVAVYFDAPKTRFDRCSLVFTPNNWASPQVLRVVSEPFATLAVAERQVPITFQAYSEDCNWIHNGKTVSFPTRRDPGGAGRCQVTGDPHFDMFDLPGTYHFQGIGDFYYVRSDILTVQARQSRCFGGTVTCVIGLGIRYGSAVFIIDGTRSDINQIVQAVTHTNGVTISRARSGSVATINMAFNSGSSIKIDIVQQGANTYSNVYFNLGTYLRGRTAGLCGTFDGTGTNDFTASSGQIFPHNVVIGESNADPGNVHNFARGPNLRAFGESWRVPASDNIFSKVATANKLPIDVLINQCLRPDPASIKCTWADPVACLDSWQSSWTFVQQGTRLRRAVIPGASTNSTCPGSSVVVRSPTPAAANGTAEVPMSTAVAAVEPGFQIVPQARHFDGTPPEVAGTPSTSRTPATAEERAEQAKLCPAKIGLFELCTEDPGKYAENCKIDIMSGTHPKTAWMMQYSAYANECAKQLCGLAESSDDEATKARANKLVLQYSFCNAPCRSDCTQCNYIGCIDCNDDEQDIRGGQCVPKSPNEPAIDPDKFGEEPATRLLARSDVAPVTTPAQDNVVVNTGALVQQNVGASAVSVSA